MDTLIKKSICSICNPNSNCGLDLHVKEGKIVKAEGMPEYKQSGGTLCSKGDDILISTSAMMLAPYRKKCAVRPLAPGRASRMLSGRKKKLVAPACAGACPTRR